MGYSVILLVTFNIGFNLMLVLSGTFSDLKVKYNKKQAKKKKITTYNAILSQRTEAKSLKRLEKLKKRKEFLER